MRQKTLSIAAIILCIVVASGQSQFLADPNDQIYQFLLLWEQKGQIDFLPSVRPYPLQIVRQALLKVQKLGTDFDSELARKFLDNLDRGTPSIPIEVYGFQYNQIRNSEYQGLVGVGAQSTGSLTENITYSLGGRLMVEKTAEGDVYPRWTNEYESTIFSEAKFTGQKKFSLWDEAFNSFGAFTGAFSFGTERFYAQAGLVRSSFGPFIQSPVLGPQAPLAGHISVTYQSERLIISSVFLELMARYGVSSDGQVYGLKGATDFFPSKYLVLHSININPFNWLNLGLFQTVVFGARLSPIYLFPFTQFIQNYFGNWDNSFIGISAQINLPLDIQYNLLLYVDDINLTELLKCNLNSNQNRIAFETGVSWIAPTTFLNKIDFTYLMITPYMYTHSSLNPTNYLQYTHQGEHIGSVLEPNSDQWRLNVLFMPLRWMNVDIWAKRVQHGNGSDYGEGTIDGDGSIFDDGIRSNGAVTYTGPSSFLIQEVLEKVWQIGLSAIIKWTGEELDAELKTSYILEFIQKRDLNPDAPDEINHYFNVGLTATY